MTRAIELLRAIEQLSKIRDLLPVGDTEQGEPLTVAIDSMQAELLTIQQPETPKSDETQQRFEAFDCYRVLGVMAS